MFKHIVLGSILFCSFIAPGWADYQTEVRLGYTKDKEKQQVRVADSIQTESATNNVQDIELRLHLDPVKTGDAPFSENAFLQRSAHIDIYHSNNEGSGGYRKKTKGIDLHWISRSQNVVLAGYEVIRNNRGLETKQFSAGFGTYLSESSYIHFKYASAKRRPGEGLDPYVSMRNEEYEIFFKSIMLLNDRADTLVEMAVRKEDDGREIDSRIGWFSGHRTQLGVLFNIQDKTNMELDNHFMGAYLEKVLGESLALKGTVGVRQFGDLDSDESAYRSRILTLEMTSRF